MNNTKSLIIFIVLSVVLLIGIWLLPKSSPALVSPILIRPAETAPYLAFKNPVPDRVSGIPYGWKVTVLEYK